MSKLYAAVISTFVCFYLVRQSEDYQLSKVGISSLFSAFSGDASELICKPINIYFYKQRALPEFAAEVLPLTILLFYNS